LGSIGGQFELVVMAPAVTATNQQIVSPATKPPAAGMTFVMVPQKLARCYVAADMPCAKKDPTYVRITLVDASGNEYAPTSKPAIATPTIILTADPLVTENWTSFEVPSNLAGDVVLKASFTTTGTPFWFAIG
jgi:hypothetical protein